MEKTSSGDGRTTHLRWAFTGHPARSPAKTNRTGVLHAFREQGFPTTSGKFASFTFSAGLPPRPRLTAELFHPSRESVKRHYAERDRSAIASWSPVSGRKSIPKTSRMS